MELLQPVALLLLLLPLLLVPLAFLARRPQGRRTPPLSLLVVAGSGGHTTEILRLLSCLSESYSPRHYVFADSDKMSEAKICSFEQKRAETFSNSQFTLDRIPRSREVRQSWMSSVGTTLYSLLYSLPLTYRLKPDLILCNGPGTCVPVCIAALLLGLLRIKRAVIVYVESICRVETLSLSGKILYYLSDYFIVQWPELKEKYPRHRELCVWLQKHRQREELQEQQKHSAEGTAWLLQQEENCSLKPLPQVSGGKMLLQLFWWGMRAGI